MINEITKGISISLNEEFGDGYAILREASRQGLKEPCFFISCMNPSLKRFLGKRYFRKNQFAIQYFPQSGRVNEECSSTAERLFSCLEYIEVSDSFLRGTCMSYEIVDGVLSFFVSYDCFMRGPQEEDPVENITVTNHVEG